MRRAGIRLEKLDQPVRLRIWQRANQHGMYDAEDGSRRPDAERQRQRGRDGDDGCAAQAAPGLSNILAQYREMFSTLRHDTDRQRIQRLMRAAPWSKSVRDTEEVRFVNRV